MNYSHVFCVDRFGWELSSDFISGSHSSLFLLWINVLQFTSILSPLITITSGWLLG